MITLNLSAHEIPVVASIIESVGSGFFACRIRRYLRDTINSIPAMTNNSAASINIDDWVAIWLLSTLYMSEINGPAQSLLFKLEDSLNAVEPIFKETTDPMIVIS
jgi:hypothetical protein